jgi:hypothetical protein
LMGDDRRALDDVGSAIAIVRELRIDHYLCEYLCDRSEICLRLDDLARAEAARGEAAELARGLKNQRVAFQCRLLEVQLLGQQDHLRGLEKLRHLLSDCATEEETAAVHAELFRSTGEQASKTVAENIYHELYRTTGLIRYKLKLDFLNK